FPGLVLCLDCKINEKLSEKFIRDLLRLPYPHTGALKKLNGIAIHEKDATRQDFNGIINVRNRVFQNPDSIFEAGLFGVLVKLIGIADILQGIDGAAECRDRYHLGRLEPNRSGESGGRRVVEGIAVEKGHRQFNGVDRVVVKKRGGVGCSSTTVGMLNVPSPKPPLSSGSRPKPPSRGMVGSTSLAG
ncbi:MAG: hypothetical protein GTO40_25260, partial [Deltaproteobacteria bacterium]|nr:hypothetical protein [Deltaproteobacteria bacterium]